MGKAKKRASRSQPPRKPQNLAVRKHEYLKRHEVDALRKAAGQLGRQGHRDSTMILFCYRHGLRATELVSMLDWHQVDLVEKTVMVRRCKGSKDTEHTLEKDEIAALKKLGESREGPVFVSERGGVMSERAFHNIVARAGKKAGLGAHIHPHQLRHACGFDMVGRGIPLRLIQDWLGHKNIRHTVWYTQLGPERFKKTKMW